MDYEALARQFGGSVAGPAPAPAAPAQATAATPAADPAAMAAQFGGQVVQDEPGFFGSLIESVTGSRRSAAPDVQAALAEGRTIYDMPETNQMSFGLLKSALGGLMAGSEERAKIFVANFPGMTYRKDEQGTVFMRSPSDGKEYVIEPGLTTQDAPRIAASLAAFTPAGAATTIPRAVVGAGLTQTAIEASQAAAGGEFSPGEVALAAATGPAGQIIERVKPPVVQAVQRGVERIRGQAPAAPVAAAPVAAPVVPAAPAAAAAPTGQSKTATLFDDWLQTSRTEDQVGRDVFSAINRRAQAAPDVDFELRLVKTSDVFPTQVGDDYLNASSMETARKIAGAKSIQEIDRVEDVLPIRLDQNMRIIDGNHRHAAAVLNQDEFIQALVPVGKGTGKVVNIDAIKQGAPIAGRVEAPMPAATAGAAAAPPVPPAPGVSEAIETITDGAPTSFTATMERTDVSEVLSLARKAAGMGPGSSAAKARLVDMAQVNPEALAAAQRLGIEVPFDVLSDNAQVRSAVGLTRALVAGEAEAAWEATTRAAIQRADEISQQFDAAFIEGRPAPGMTSQRILDSLKNTQNQLQVEAKTIYDRIDGVDGGASGTVPKATIISLPNLEQTLQRVSQNVGDQGLSAQEKSLLELATQPGVTYGRLLREKSLIGKALEGKDSPYGNMAAGDLKVLYSALAQDQLDNVGNIAGDEVRRELRAANLMTAKRKALEKRIIGAFGKEIDGSVAQRMQSAITTAAKGDAAGFNRLMKVVPPDLQRETLATALASVTAGKGAGRAAGAGETVFSPAEFTKVYRGLRANPPVYAQMVKIMGPEWDRASRDLFELSRRIADAQSRIPVTGKANQILGEMAVEGLIGKVMSSGITQRVVTGVVGTAVPGGGVIAPDLVQWMSGTKGAAVQKAGKLFASPEFQELAVEAATTGTAKATSIRKTAMSKSFQQFADAARLPKDLDARMQFLQSAIQTERQFDQENQ